MEREAGAKIKRFGEAIKRAFGDVQVYLFGSRATKDCLVDSDFDVIIVSKKFEGTSFYRRPERMYGYWNEKEPLDVFCYTPAEFEAKKKLIGFVQESLQNAKQVIG